MSLLSTDVSKIGWEDFFGWKIIGAELCWYCMVAPRIMIIWERSEIILSNRELSHIPPDFWVFPLITNGGGKTWVQLLKKLVTHALKVFLALVQGNKSNVTNTCLSIQYGSSLVLRLWSRQPPQRILQLPHHSESPRGTPFWGLMQSCLELHILKLYYYWVIAFHSPFMWCCIDLKIVRWVGLLNHLRLSLQDSEGQGALWLKGFGWEGLRTLLGILTSAVCRLGAGKLRLGEVEALACSKLHSPCREDHGIWKAKLVLQLLAMLPQGTWDTCSLEQLACTRSVKGALTRPSSLSSKARTPVLSVNSFTFTAGSAWVVEKSPWVPQLWTEWKNSVWRPLPGWR